MSFVSDKPRGPLSEFVDSVWFYEGEAPAHARERRLPTGGAGLVVNLRDDRCSVRSDAGEPRDYPGVVVSGPFTRPFVLDPAQQCETMGVEFKIGGAASLLGLPLDELRDLHVPLTELWSSHATELRERVLAAPSPSAKLVAVEQVLSIRLAQVSHRPHPAAARAAARIAAAPERCGIAELSEALGMSSRRLEQVFRADVGLTPKAHQCLQRFRQALIRIDRGALVGWAPFALERGYYDQSHFIQEFRTHCGLTPSDYLASRGTFLNHVPVSP